MPILSTPDEPVEQPAAEPEPPKQKLNGAGLRALREDFGWPRRTLSEFTGLTISRIAMIEMGKREPTDVEARMITDVLLNTLEETLDAPAPVSLVKDAPEGTKRFGEWNGLRRGDPCKVRGQSGTFRFLYFHEDDHQTYVGVFGPTFTRQKNPRAPGSRSFAPEKIMKVK